MKTNQERLKDLFQILVETSDIITEDEINERERIEILIMPILRSLGFECEMEPKLPGDQHLRPDFMITNLPLKVVGEVKRPKGYEQGVEQIQDYITHDAGEQVGILTDGYQWEIFVVNQIDQEMVVHSFSQSNLAPVVREIRKEGIKSLENLDSRTHLEQFISTFSRPQFQKQITELDLFSENIDVRSLAEVIDVEGLELLRQEANQKLSTQLEQYRFYQSTGYRIGRTAIISISILVSIVALLVNTSSGDANISPFLNVQTISGTVLIFCSALIGIAGPVVVGWTTEQTPQRIYREYFELAIPDEPSEGITSKKDILTTLLTQSCEMGQTFRGIFYYQYGTIALALVAQVIGILLIIVGVVNAL